ncbi:MAG: VacJ family lipoprotein [Alphaproteobacteria bacterium]
MKTFLNMKKFMALFGVMACLFMAGCATNQEPIYVGDIKVDDRFESYNRSVFAFNQAVDSAVIHPVVRGYRTVVPSPIRTGLRNFLRTLRSPINFGNKVLQGDVQGAANVMARLIINVLVGAGGLFDVAGYEGIEYEQEDFGQTLAVWGVGHGPYLVMPFIGPSSLRDYTGYIVDGFADPLRWYLFNIEEHGIYYTKLGLDYLDLRESLIDVLEELEASSIDYYAATRSIYYQRRQALVNDEGRRALTPMPDFDDY